MAGARLRRHVLEAPVAEIAVEQLRLPVGEVQLAVGDLRVDVAVGDEDVLPAVVVEVEEVDAEADVLAVDAEAGPDAGVARTPPPLLRYSVVTCSEKFVRTMSSQPSPS